MLILKSKPHFFRVQIHFKHAPSAYFWAVKVNDVIRFGSTPTKAWQAFLCHYYFQQSKEV